MANSFEAFRSRFSKTSPPSRTEIRETFESQLAADETVKHRLTSSKLVHERDGEQEFVPDIEEGSALVVVTDQKILLAVILPDDEWIREVPYTDIRNVDVDDGLLRSTFIVDVWAEGTYRVRTPDSDTLTTVVSYVTEATYCWQYATTKVQAATERMPELSDQLEDGRLGKVHETREKIRTKLEQASAAVEDADIEPIPALQDRIDDARTELHRTEIYARLTRATTLMTEANYLTDVLDYTGAYQRYWDARDHLENARMLARRAGIEEPAVIEGHLDEIEAHIENLRVRPLALAKQAHERAETTEKLDVRVDTLEQAFEHYRDALTAGWGTDYEFAGDREHIRSRVEQVVADLVDARQEIADKHLTRGDGYRDDGDILGAWREYERAAEHIEEGAQLAREFRAGDPEVFANLDVQLEERL